MNTRDEKIRAVKNQMRSIERLLPYADGPAWTQDRDRLRELQNELDRLQRQQHDMNNYPQRWEEM